MLGDGIIFLMAGVFMKDRVVDLQSLGKGKGRVSER